MTAADKLAQALQQIIDRAAKPDCPHLDGPTDFAISQSRRRTISHIALLASEALAAFRAAPGAEPVAWTLQSELDARETTCRAHLWFANPRNSSWVPLYAAAQPEPSAPAEWTPEMSRAVQLYSELGAYAASNLSGAYGLFEEFWNVAHRAALSSPPQQAQPEPLSDGQIIAIAEHTRDCSLATFVRAIERAHGIGAKTGGA